MDEKMSELCDPVSEERGTSDSGLPSRSPHAVRIFSRPTF